MTLSNQAAIDEVRRLAASFGVDCEPAAIADRSNLVLHLAPHALVARVAMATSMVRAGVAWLEREVLISRFLDARGGAVTRPAASVPAGPFERGGFVVSFWELERLLPAEPDPRQAGVELARAHRLLRELPGPLPPAWGAWTEMRAVLERMATSPFFDHARRARVTAAWSRAEAIVASSHARSRSLQLVHGDAHLRNVLCTERGTLWTDWEDAFVGPIEWDLACVRGRFELFGEDADAVGALSEGYDEPVDAELVRDLGLVRNVQVVLWLAVFAERDPALLPRMWQRFEQLPP